MFLRGADGQVEVPDDARILLRKRPVRSSSDDSQTEEAAARLPFDMSQVEQVNALLGMLDAELRRRDAESRRRDALLQEALRLAGALTERLLPAGKAAPPPSQ